ncbi:MAG: ester cyclase [Chloroflexi bacterium]|nr:ester cyclase [Chloroflexota bacterium]MCI0649171.1 ester cyclase [Chloroflexota bacterium]MCI0725338.1 ester cyclase [Chloroflexota bacterium]
MTEDNKAIVRKWVEAWVGRDLALLDQLFAPNYSVNGRLIGVEGVKQAVQFLHAALSGVSVELNEMVAEGDKVVARWTVRGVHTGDFMGVPPTGKEVELKGINIYEVVEGKIVANHEQTNVPEVIQSLKVDS